MVVIETNSCWLSDCRNITVSISKVNYVISCVITFQIACLSNLKYRFVTPKFFSPNFFRVYSKAAKVGVPDVHVFYGNSYPKCMLARGTTWGCLLAFWEVQKRLKCAVGCLRSVKLLAAQVVNLLFMAFHFSPHIKIVWILPPSGTHKRFNPSD